MFGNCSKEGNLRVRRFMTRTSPRRTPSYDERFARAHITADNTRQPYYACRKTSMIAFVVGSRTKQLLARTTNKVRATRFVNRAGDSKQILHSDVILRSAQNQSRRQQSSTSQNKLLLHHNNNSPIVVHESPSSKDVSTNG